MAVPPAKGWVSTIKLPKTKFPFRTPLRNRAEFLKRCTDDLYVWQSQSRNETSPFILNDGPLYANGGLHVGHALNKILKDMICRVELNQGRRVQYVPGWDCHGIPIEIKALEQYEKSNKGRRLLSANGVRRVTRDLAIEVVQEQKKCLREWAIMADWDNAWTTMDRDFEVLQLKVFQEMVRKGLIFRRCKPVYWSPSSRTTLAEAELEYKDNHESTAAYVKYSMSSIPQWLTDQGVDVQKLSALIWTTIPWTLAANRAIAIHPDLDYVIIEVDSKQLLVVESRLDHIGTLYSLNLQNSIIAQFKGSHLQGATYLNMFSGLTSAPQPLILADFVSADSGSGVVHCAPGHGVDDYEACIKHGIAAFSPVDNEGCFTDHAFPSHPQRLKGKPVLGCGGEEVLKILGNKVLQVHNYRHKYPYDWHTKLPVIVRATEQWFADVASIKGDVLASLEDVEFVPLSGRSRLKAFVLDRSEWCISRQRAWGVPIPALYDEDGNAVMTEQTVAHIISVISERGSDAWWLDAEDDPAWIAPGLQGSYRRGQDTMDVLFDSGSSWTRTEGRADLCIEGSDQHRGWFQSSLLTHIGASDHKLAPFRKLITHGFALGQDGRKMSKYMGNVIEPEQIMKGLLVPVVKHIAYDGDIIKSPDKLGPDALRLWVARSDYTQDITLGQNVLASVNKSLLNYRAIIKMLLGSMRKDTRNLPLTMLDKIALVQLERAMIQVWKTWETYDFPKAVHIIDRWLKVELSAFYLEAVKDRLYCGDGHGVYFQLFNGLLQMLSPMVPLLVEEAWAHRPEWVQNDPSIMHPLQQILNPDSPLSVPPSLYRDAETDMPYILDANEAIKYAQEYARKAELIGSSLDSSVILSFPDTESQARFKKYEDELADIFVVSSVQLGVRLPSPDASKGWKFDVQWRAREGGGDSMAVAWVVPPTGGKCPRCWRHVVPATDKLCKRCESVLKDAGIDISEKES